MRRLLSLTKHLAAPLMVVTMMIAGGDGPALYRNYMESPYDGGDVSAPYVAPAPSPTPTTSDCVTYKDGSVSCPWNGPPDEIHRGR